ncbi:hypothetical protein ADP71_40550 [Vitreoscilla sp. C1]|nr:hypothetical protein ADP71_40550 [Vitreoscilla sp. C1]
MVEPADDCGRRCIVYVGTKKPFGNSQIRKYDLDISTLASIRSYHCICMIKANDLIYRDTQYRLSWAVLLFQYKI